MAEKKSWLKIIGRLKKLVADVGPIWPKSTKLAGFASDGPYFCGMCEYMKGMKQGKVFKDDKGWGRCIHPVMIADSEAEKESGFPIIKDPEHQCCEFVERFKKKD